MREHTYQIGCGTCGAVLMEANGKIINLPVASLPTCPDCPTRSYTFTCDTQPLKVYTTALTLRAEQGDASGYGEIVTPGYMAGEQEAG